MSRNYKRSRMVPSRVLAERLDELANVVAAQRREPRAFESQFTMSIPARVDRDADLVMAEASKRLEHCDKVLEAIQDFVDRVDKGEVRSVRTYTKFKELLGERGELSD